MPSRVDPVGAGPAVFRWPIHPTVRLRLTLMYAALFLAAGIMMIAILYVLMSRALAPPEPRGGVGQFPPGEITGIERGQDDEPSIEDQIDETRREERASALRQVQIQAGIALLASVVVALAFGWVIAGRVLRPIRDITTHARNASETTLDERIDLRGPPDELKELADTIDGMLQRLQSAFESQRQFAAKASHELRTPLAIIGAEADIVADAPDASDRERATAHAIRAATDRSERLISGLLMLARSESTMRDDAQVDLADLVGDVVGELVELADVAGVEIDLVLDSAFVRGDHALLTSMIGNLVGNAIRYNVPGGWVRIVTGQGAAGSTLLVENTGRGLPVDDVDALFEPFQRGLVTAGDRQTGFGLGLAIVRSVVDVHRGEISATARPDGGLRILVTLRSVETGRG